MGCAVQNLHLAAAALPGGLCGYWSSWYGAVRDSHEMRDLLGLAEHDRRALRQPGGDCLSRAAGRGCLRVRVWAACHGGRRGQARRAAAAGCR